jgi:hypothetical protein
LAEKLAKLEGRIEQLEKLRGQSQPFDMIAQIAPWVALTLVGAAFVVCWHFQVLKREKNEADARKAAARTERTKALFEALPKMILKGEKPLSEVEKLLRACYELEKAKDQEGS